MHLLEGIDKSSKVVYFSLLLRLVLWVINYKNYLLIYKILIVYAKKLKIINKIKKKILKNFKNFVFI